MRTQDYRAVMVNLQRINPCAVVATEVHIAGSKARSMCANTLVR